MKAVLGLDIGTSRVKAVIIGEDGSRFSEGSSQPIPLVRPRPGWAEQDPAELGLAVREAIAASKAPQFDLAAVAVAGQSGSVVIIGEDEQAAGPFITWMDERAAGIVNEWEQSEVAARVRALSGWPAAAHAALSTLVWVARNEPEVFRKASRFAGPVDFVTHRLTGRWFTNPSNGAGLQLLDVESGKWSDELCEMASLDPKQLSELRPSGEVAGEVTTSASQATGLPVGLPVVNGGHDQTATAYALNVVDPGTVLIGCGTAWVITGVAPRPSAPVHLSVSYHLVPGRYCVSVALGELNEIEEAEAGIRSALKESALTGGGSPSVVATGGWLESVGAARRLATLVGTTLQVPRGEAWPAVGAAKLAGCSVELFGPERIVIDWEEFAP